MSLVSIVGALVLGGGMLVRKSPLMYETRAPGAQWADGPMKLVPTPQYESGKDDLLTTSATHMALLHNSLIRGYNSIRLQVPHVRDEDKADFVGYTRTWLRFIKSHHDDEEELLFPEMRSMLSDPEVWHDVPEEHETLLSELNKLDGYLGSLSNATALTPGALLDIMDALHPTLEHHLHHEVSVMADMATHVKAPVRDSFEGAVASASLKAWGKNTVRKAGVTDVLPFFLLNADRTAEKGMWMNWPPIPGPIRWAMVNVVGAVHGGWWRFASCDAHGRPRELHALAAGGGDARTEL
ncbi:hypothetical protein G6O67_007433 [Ophiocordyceps sinensis]|uniref:Hemerythrin-like domain-containing protein n=2 Tax=Ophiocordyceps sinensis TaxID=72228 RepID=A0A8H4LTU5_9HYPO|nr:hemerythrin HHE cation binding domain-containing protein [Ophiocordyceps sinensis CO18]KAF4505489.1 hypothetical protein G6O67_007433 [Ophiocordyceps sinensis]